MGEWRSGMFVVPLNDEPVDESRFAYWRDRDMAFDHDRCFLCGVTLSTSNRTDEHVLPKWMQRRFKLWNQTLTLLNGTGIRYRSLTIPCCHDCNSFWLAQVEKQVAAAFDAGREAVAQLDKTLLCTWMWKVYYGLQFKQLALARDRREADGPAIVSPGYLGRFAELHHVLQSIRRRVRFARVPGSVYVFAAQVPDPPEHQFDFRDSRLTPFLALRAGDTIVMASFDWAAMTTFITDSPRLDAASKLALHPSQFAEIAAHGAYIAAKFNREFAYVVTSDGDCDVIEPVAYTPPGASSDGGRLFSRPDDKEWAFVLAEALGCKAADLIDPAGGGVWTSLLNADGTPCFLGLDAAPFGAVLRPAWTRPRDEPPM